MQAVLDDLQAKQEELKQAVEERQKQKETIQAAFQKAFGGASGTASNLSGQAGLSAGPSGQAQSSKVVDLGVVGQGRRRINLAPVQTSTGLKPEPHLSSSVKKWFSIFKRALSASLPGQLFRPCHGESR